MDLGYFVDLIGLGHLIILDIIALEIYNPGKYGRLLELYNQTLID